MTASGPISLQSRFQGCLLGGAVGDALGAPIEFRSHAEIEERYGSGGPDRLGVAYGVEGAVTDDTQMTLWTADGLLRAHLSGTSPEAALHQAYLRWLVTQDGPRAHPDVRLDGWLIDQKALWAERAPGLTCLGALRSGRRGTVDDPINTSKGCGGVMRVAPVGLLFGPEAAFDMARTAAAITHGHPTGYAAAGAFAFAVSRIIEGASVADALTEAEGAARRAPDGAETADALASARDLAGSGTSDTEAVQALAVVTPERGPGWVAEEALAVAAFTARRYPNDVHRALRVSVTHSGDSDSTGAICGNLLGAALGVEAVPWRDDVELADVVLQVADDLHDARTGGSGWKDRYPG